MFPKNSSTFLLIIIVFFVSFAASGIVPLFAYTLKQHHISWGFIPYFSFVLIGQITIYFDRYKKVTTSMIPILVLAFTSTLVFLICF